MRFSKVTFAVGAGMFVAAAVGVAGTWALVTSTVVMGLAALVAVVVMEERDYIAVEGLYPQASASPPDAAAVPPADDLAQAA